MDLSRARLELHIDELVLDGIQVPDREALAAAVSAELTHLLAGGPLPQGLSVGGAFPRLDAGAVRLEPGLGGEPLGRRIARAIHQGLQQPGGGDVPVRG